MSGGLINQMPFIRYLAPSACGYNQILDVLNRMWTFLQVSARKTFIQAALDPHRKLLWFFEILLQF